MSSLAVEGVRDLVAERLDGRYAEALERLVALRRRVLAERGAAAWRAAVDDVIGADFCPAVESGVLAERLAAWD